MASWQVYMVLAAVATAFAVAGTHRKPAHFRALAKIILVAALYRAVMCLVFYFGHVRDSGVEAPATFTSHDDTVLWVVAIMFLVVNALHQRGALALGALALGAPLMVAAIQLNNRRLAWMSLAGSLVALYYVLPRSASKTRLRLAATVLVPVIAVYVAVGWSNPVGIFKPVGAFSTVSDASDSSTKARNVENLSLIATARFNPLTGTGWGHGYIELSNRYSIARATELWPFIPHNSVLGLFAYTGMLGVMGLWMMFPTAVFLHARVARIAAEPEARAIGIMGVLMLVVCLNQMFGDMGIQSRPTMYMLAVAFGAALTVPANTGAWPAAVPAPTAMPAPAAGSVSPV